jgi:hypothetical protein
MAQQVREEASRWLMLCLGALDKLDQALRVDSELT